MLRRINDGVTTIKPGHQTNGNACMICQMSSSFTLFLTSGRVYVWRRPKETYDLECLVPTVKHGGILWCSILLVPLLPFMAILLQGSTWTGWVISDLDISEQRCSLPRQHCPLHKAATVQSCFEEHEGELQHLTWPAQSPNLNITEPVLETRSRNIFPPPTSLKQLENFPSRRMVWSSARDCSKLVRVHSMDYGWTEDKGWSNTILIKDCVQYPIVVPLFCPILVCISHK
jgi:hypothetical protein